jgi:Flp pilus assembly protein TadG
VSGHKARRRRGQGLVEFALVAPVFLLILLAIFDFGRGVFAYTSVSNAAREGARLAIVNQDKTLILSRIRAQSAIAESANGDGTDLTVDFRRADANGNPVAGSSCLDGDGYVSIGCLAVVTYNSKFDLITPIVRQVVWPSGVTLTSTSILPVEFTCPNPTITTSSGCPDQP